VRTSGESNYLDLEAGAGYSSNPSLSLVNNGGSAFGRISVHGVHSRVSARSTTLISAYAEDVTYTNHRGSQQSINVYAHHDAAVTEHARLFGDVSATYQEGGQLYTRVLGLPVIPPVTPGGTILPPILVPPTADFLSITGRESIPTDATAVVVNVTITQADAPGYVSVWPTGSPQQVSNLNVDRAGGTIANLATVKLGSDGKITLFSETGGHLIADLVGYYLPVNTATSDGRFVALDPTRVLDTRISLGSAQVSTVPNSTVRVHVLGAEGVPSTGVRAVVAVVTATGAEPGFVTAWSGHGARPLASSLNVDRSGQTRSNQIIVPVDDDGSISLFTEAGTQLIVDVAGYITDANAAPITDGLFVPLDPFRALDTRSALGGVLGPLPAGRVASIVVDVPQSAHAIVGNFTATQALAPGFVTIYPKTTGPVPNVSNLNLDEADQTRAVHAMVKLGPGRGISLFTERGAQLLADIGGYYL